jgi:hypothetical protein
LTRNHIASADKVRRAVAAYDTHYPQYSRGTWRTIFDYVEQNPPDVFVFGGDQFHFDCISHHTLSMPLYRTRRAYKNDIEGFERDILAPLERLLPKHCEKIWIIGNHERFEFDLIEAHPELEGVVDHVKLLRLKERGWKIIPLGHAYKLGKLTLIHGETLSGIGNQAGMYPSRKAVELYAGNVLAGHTHAPQTFTRVSPVEHTNKWQGHIAPTAGNVNPSYLRNRPTAWLNGFCLVDVLPSGQFSYVPVIVVNKCAIIAGKKYGGI